MRIGSFFLILLAALIALGYLLSDSIHLHEDMSTLQKEIETLSQALQQAEQEKQNALIALQNLEQEKQDTLTALQNAGQELQLCQRQVEQSNQIIGRLTNENTSLKEQNRRPVTSGPSSNAADAPPQPQIRMAQSTAFSLITFIALGIGSIVMVVLKGLQKQLILKRHATKTGNYVYLTDAEIRELVQRRRNATKPNTQYSSR